jgi:hypothetical protein
MSIYLKWAQTLKDTQGRFIANLFSNLSNKWYPVNIIGSSLYDILSMYGLEFASGSVGITQAEDDLFIETVRTGLIDGHTYSKMYENFGVFVNANKTPYQEYDRFNSGSVINSYRTMLKFLTLAHIEGTTKDALGRIGQAYTGISPVIVEPIKNYPGWVLTTYTGSVIQTIYNADDKQRYVEVTPPWGRYGATLPVLQSTIPVSSSISLSYSVLGINTVIYDQDFYRAGVLLYFFISGSMGYTASVMAGIANAVDRVLPAYIKPLICYSSDFVSWRPAVPTIDTMVAGSTVFAVSPFGWVYNAIPTVLSGSIYTTGVIQVP